VASLKYNQPNSLYKELNMHDNPEYYIPIFLFLALASTTIAALFFWSRNKVAQQETLRQAIQAGQKLDENTLKLLIKPPMTPDADLRQGIMTTCLAIGFASAALFCTIMGLDRDLFAVLGMITIIIGSVGAGQLISWKVRRSLEPTPKNTEA
jgi:hypothetical protein